MSQSLFYWIIYSYGVQFDLDTPGEVESQSLFYWIIYSYGVQFDLDTPGEVESQSLFYWIIYSYLLVTKFTPEEDEEGLNPYFIGLSILILKKLSSVDSIFSWKSQSLFYWIIYSYFMNPKDSRLTWEVSILILLDYLFL